MTNEQTVEFGWYPEPLDFRVGDIAIATLPGLEAQVDAVRSGPSVRADWIFAPSEGRSQSSRIFGLPKTHTLSHTFAEGPEHLEFLVWALSFFTGMRLTTEEFGFLDATPIKRHGLVDFRLPTANCPAALALADRFWEINKAFPLQARRWIAAVNALFISRSPQTLQFERFIYLYTALDACFALTKDIFGSKEHVSHAGRVHWMCRLLDMPVPAWGDASAGKSRISSIRNLTVHESTFMDAPLGFGMLGMGANQNLTQEMQALVCRLLVALVGDREASYVRTPVDRREMQCWLPGR